MKKPKKKLVIGVGAVAVVAVGAIAVLGNSGKEGNTSEGGGCGSCNRRCAADCRGQRNSCKRGRKNVFSPANAKVDQVSFKEGETVKGRNKACGI